MQIDVVQWKGTAFDLNLFSRSEKVCCEIENR